MADIYENRGTMTVFPELGIRHIQLFPFCFYVSDRATKLNVAERGCHRSKVAN